MISNFKMMLKIKKNRFALQIIQYNKIPYEHLKAFFCICLFALILSI